MHSAERSSCQHINEEVDVDPHNVTTKEAIKSITNHRENLKSVKKKLLSNPYC
jgi:hypothetical protein